VIGTGGKVIREIVEKTGAKIDIEDDGTVKVASSMRRVDRRGDQVDQGIVAEPEVGQIYNGKVVKVDGVRRLRELLRRQGRPRPHLAAGRERVNHPTDVVKEGDR
jgi:polyribonucleotide nucleotidyltransferase